MNFDTLLNQFRTRIDLELDALVPLRPNLSYNSLFASARYSLLAPGKRLRPLLLMATVHDYGAPIDHAIIPSSSLEMIHTYSLIHDDLPCMDDDDFRRGLPTLHRAYPEWHALLTGDYLLTYAFELLTTAPSLSSEQKIALIQTLSIHAGADGMIGGQVIDLLCENQEIDHKILEEMHRCKTAALISAALVSGGIIAQASQKELEILKNIGKAVGIAFQMIDDVLDREGTKQELGKNTGSDLSNNKSTAATLFGILETKQKASEFLLESQQLLEQFPKEFPLLRHLLDKMVNRTR